MVYLKLDGPGCDSGERLPSLLGVGRRQLGFYLSLDIEVLQPQTTSHVVRQNRLIKVLYLVGHYTRAYCHMGNSVAYKSWTLQRKALHLQPLLSRKIQRKREDVAAARKRRRRTKTWMFSGKIVLFFNLSPPRPKKWPLTFPSLWRCHPPGTRCSDSSSAYIGLVMVVVTLASITTSSIS